MPASGTKLSDYKMNSAPAKKDSDKVSIWRSRIDRAKRLLDFRRRAEHEIRAREYLENRNKVNGDKGPNSYLLPLVEELHRRTVPEIPEVHVTAKDVAAEELESVARELLDKQMRNERAGVLRALNAAMWDETISGMGFLKTTWDVEAVPAPTRDLRDAEETQFQVDRAWAENEDPVEARVAEDDMDYAHLEVHSGAVADMDPNSEEWALMWKHMDEHRARMVTIKREGPKLSRVPWDRLVWDPDNPWDDRKWEAEYRIIPVDELHKQDAINLNTHNAPPVQLDEQTSFIAYEDMAVAVWDIHDIAHNERRLISADGPSDGLFLLKSPWVYGDIDIYLPLVMRDIGRLEGFGESTIIHAIPILDRVHEVDFHISRHVKMHADYKALTPPGTSKNFKAQLNDPNVRFVEVPPEVVAGFKEYAPPPIPQPLLQYRAQLLSELRRVIGVDAQDTQASYPHQISATESMQRGQARETRIHDRQRVMGKVLSRVAKNFLTLFKTFASIDHRIRVLDANGPRYHVIDPAQLPQDIDIFLDVAGTSEDAKSQRANAAIQGLQLLMNIGPAYPTNWINAVEWALRNIGVYRPEQFRSPQPMMAPQGAQKGAPSIPGESGSPPPGAPPDNVNQRPQPQPAAQS